MTNLGELEDCDGAVYRPGDFVSFSPGSRHSPTSHKAGATHGFFAGTEPCDRGRPDDSKKVTIPSRVVSRDGLSIP